jgi:hypothetical protein
MERAFIVFRWLNGDGIKKLARENEVDRKPIQKLIKKYQLTGEVFDYPHTGRKRKTSEREDRTIQRISKKDRFLTAKAIALKEAPNFVKNKISTTTVRRRLKEKELNGRVAAKKPLLKPLNKKRRLEWAKAHADWTSEMWRRVIFSDESPFQVFQDGGKIYVRRQPGERFSEECILPTVKHGGGSIQVWGCFNYSGKGPLKRIEGIMDGEMYRRILVYQMAPFLKNLKGEIGVEPIFQHDNDPKHTSKKAQKYLSNKEFEVLDWPSQSPDLNPIEHVWRQLKLAIFLRTDKASSLDEVFNIVKEEWDKFPLANLHKLVDSMPDRIQEVIAAKGGHTHY